MSTCRSGGFGWLAVIAFWSVLGAGCNSDRPLSPTTTAAIVESGPVTVTNEPKLDEFQEPAVPDAGGEGLPDTPGGTEEIDCENAEELCDSGEWACDDIADYCDIGPDDGSELPDDWDWDS